MVGSARDGKYTVSPILVISADGDIGQIFFATRLFSRVLRILPLYNLGITLIELIAIVDILLYFQFFIDA
jgi:hypothetical protein